MKKIIKKIMSSLEKKYTNFIEFVKPYSKTIFIDSTLATILCFAIMFVFLNLFSSKYFEPFKESFRDFQITDITYSDLRDDISVRADPNIVLIDVWRLNKPGLAQLIKRLNDNNPAVVAIDKIFTKGDNKLNDLVLADALKNTDNLVMAYRLSNNSEGAKYYDEMITSDSMFIQNASMGYSNLMFGKNKEISTVREFVPKHSFKGKELFSFGVQTAKNYNPAVVENLFSRNKNREIINYRADWKKFTFLEGIKVLKEDVDRNVIEGKILILGDVGAFREYELLEELYFTPLNERIAGRTLPDMSGVEIHANIVSMIKTGDYYGEMPLWIGFLLAVILCYVNMWIFSYICIKNKTWFEINSLLIFLLESVALLYLTVQIFNKYHYQCTFTIALFAVALSVFIYQIYNETFKPFYQRLSNKLKNSKVST